MNPLAKIVFKLLAAIDDDPKYTAERNEAQLELGKHVIQLSAVAEDRYAPILMQCAVMGLTEEDYEQLEKHMSARCSGLKKRQAEKLAEEKAKVIAQLQQHQTSIYDHYKQQLELQRFAWGFYEEKYKPKKAWWKRFK